MKNPTVKLSKSAKLEKITFHPSILKNDDEKWKIVVGSRMLELWYGENFMIGFW